MSQRIGILLLLIILELASNVQAYTYYRCNKSGNWADPNIWMDNVGVPKKESGQVLIYGGTTVDVTCNGQYMWDGGIGYDTTSGSESSYAQSGATVNVAKGIEFGAFALVIGNMGGIGILNINGTVVCDWHIRVGVCTGCQVGTPACGSINVNNGGMLIVGGDSSHFTQEVGEGSPGSINLKGTGSMIVDGDGGWHLDLNGGRGHIDIEAGYLKVLGDYRTPLQDYVNHGWITSYGGLLPRYSLKVSFLDGYTYVKTIDQYGD